MITAPRCRHIKTNGLTCKSPALQNGSRCFFHNRQMLRHTRFRAFAAAPGLTKPGEHLPLIPVDDHDSIQLALSMVINGLAIGHLETLRAKALLYGLQIASINAKNIRPEPVERYDLPLSTQTDAVGDELAQPGDAVDITHPSVEQKLENDRLKARYQRESDELQAWIANTDEDGNDPDDEEDDDYEQDEEEHEEAREDEDDSDEEDDLKVINQVEQFMRRHP